MLLPLRVKSAASIMKVFLFLVATVALQFNPSHGWYDEVDRSVGSPWGSGQSGRGPSKFNPSHGWYGEVDQSVGSPWGSGQSGRGPSKFNPSIDWYDEDAEDEEEVVGFFSRRFRGGRSETKCMFIGGQCPYKGKGCCQGRPPWSNQYKVDCINGRCTRIAK